MSVRIITIPEELEGLLGFLYPGYTITNSFNQLSRFIVKKDVRSRSEAEYIKATYANGVVISNQIFDEVWNAEKIEEECLNFMHRTLRSRKRTLSVTTNSVEGYVTAMFEPETDGYTGDIYELFDSFGSSMFVEKYLQKTNSVPRQILFSSMLTFVFKLLQDTTNVYYLKKQQVYKEKVKSNALKAINSYLLRDSDDTGLSEIKLFVDLLV